MIHAVATIDAQHRRRASRDVLEWHPGCRHSASLRAFTPVFDGLWTRVNALMALSGLRRLVIAQAARSMMFEVAACESASI